MDTRAFVLVLIVSGVRAVSILVGEQAPLDFTLVDQHTKQVNLRALLAQGKPLVLLFVPFAFTGVCSAELCSKNGALEQFAKLNAHVVGVSGDSNFVLAEWAKKEHITIPLLSDYDHAVTRAFGVHSPGGFKPAANLVFGTVPKRSAFVVGTDGVVRYAEVLANAGEMPNFAAIEAALGALSQRAPLKVGDKAPDFQLVNVGAAGPELVKLADVIAVKPAVLMIVPLAFTPVCTTSLCTKNGFLDKFAKHANVWGITGCSPFAIKNWREAAHINTPVLSDYDHAACQAFGVTYNAPLDADLTMRSIPKRSAFVVDKAGVIRYAEVLEDAGKEVNYEAIEKALESI